MKRAIIYYSLSENTKDAAEKIASELEIPAFRIDLVTPLPTEKGKQMMTGGMQATFGLKPPITGVPDDLSSYDDIIIGTPIWAGKTASPINTLLREYGIADKVTSVFTCSGGGDNDKCIKRLRKILKNLKSEVALIDKNYKPENENNSKLSDFIALIK